MKSATFKIEGMHCDGCAQNVLAILTAKTGVQTASVSFKDAQARVLYDPRAIDETELAAVIEKSGYQVAAKST